MLPVKIAIALALSTTIMACNNTSNTKTLNADNKLHTIAGIEHIETVSKSLSGISIPYKKYVLENGLTVIVHEDNSDPLVHIDVSYHVGSAREELGKSGFAHFYEHMMFQGSENVADDEHFKLITQAGGSLQGTTSRDLTNYYQTVPVNQLEKVLWLEADRMGFLLSAVTQEKFEVQRETVKNERGQRIDNVPYASRTEKIDQALYPYGHPYSWPLIGYMDDLNNADVNDIKDFYQRWYGPNNATLTIGGNVTPSEVLTLVNKYFSPIPAGPEVTNLAKELIKLTENRYISMEDNVQFPLLEITYPTVFSRHEDEAALHVLANIIGSGKSSLLYKNLIANQLALEAVAIQPCMEISCSFKVISLPHPASGKTLSDIEKIVKDSFTEFAKRGVNQSDINKVTAKMESELIFKLQSVEGKVSTLASYQTLSGEANIIEAELNRYAQVTPDDVMRVFNQYINNKPAVIMSVVPHGKKELVAAKDDFEPKLFSASSQEVAKISTITQQKTIDSFDRSIQPKAGKAPIVTIPATWREETENGMQLLGTQSDETPTTSILIKVPGGLYHQTVDKPSSASFTAGMLNESTLNFSNAAMSDALEQLGSNINISVDESYTNILVTSLTKNLDKTLILVQEKMLSPAFNDSDFQRLQQQSLQMMMHLQKNASHLADSAYKKLLFGDTIAGFTETGTLASVSALTLNDVKDFYRSHFKPEGAKVIIVSDLAQQQVAEKISVTFKDWQGKAPKVTATFGLPEFDKNTIYLVNKEDAAQSEIRIGKRGLTKDIQGEYFKTRLMNFTLGGNFNSRINLNLREDKGYSYGAGSTVWGSKYAGGFTTATAVRSDVTDKSLIELTKEINNFSSNGVTMAEHSFMQQAINQKDALKFETPRAKLSFLALILEYNLSKEFIQKQTEIVENISKNEINDLARKHLNTENMVYVVVGNAKELTPKLTALGYQVKGFQL
jgi:zinc protease